MTQIAYKNTDAPVSREGRIVATYYGPAVVLAVVSNHASSAIWPSSLSPVVFFGGLIVALLLSVLGLFRLADEQRRHYRHTIDFYTLPVLSKLATGEPSEAVASSFGLRHDYINAIMENARQSVRASALADEARRILELRERSGQA